MDSALSKLWRPHTSCEFNTRTSISDAVMTLLGYSNECAEIKIVAVFCFFATAAILLLLYTYKKILPWKQITFNRRIVFMQ